MKLRNQVAIVTGAATGIGKAIATAMASEGASVVIDYVGAPAQANAVVQSIQASGGKALAVPADVSNPDQVSQLIQKTIDSFGRLDILVNNAGLEYKHPSPNFLSTSGRK
jgi:NAD(P)-dependent dehydrogenase (short-subunit alcohol dehydrogenase family)